MEYMLRFEGNYPGRPESGRSWEEIEHFIRSSSMSKLTSRVASASVEYSKAAVGAGLAVLGSLGVGQELSDLYFTGSLDDAALFVSGVVGAGGGNWMYEAREAQTTRRQKLSQYKEMGSPILIAV